MISVGNRMAITHYHVCVLSVLFLSENAFLNGGGGGGGAVAQSVERATPGEVVPCSIPLWPHAPYWLDRCQYNVTG